MLPEFYKEINGNLIEELDSFNNLFYKKIKEKGYKWEDVKKYYEENYTFTPNFKELFEYLKKIKINLIYY